MADIFVSYAHEDRLRIQPLVDRLQQEGWSIWWDREIKPGRNYEQLIDREIQQSRCILVAWTNAALASRWVHNEALEGLERDILVPIMFDDVRVPVAFRQTQAAMLLAWPKEYEETELQSLIAGISDTLALSEPEASESESLEQETEHHMREPAFEPKVSPVTGENNNHRSLFTVVAVLFVAVLGWFAFQYWQQQKRIDIASSDGMAALDVLIQAREFHAALVKATELQTVLGDEPLAEKWAQFSSPYSLKTIPPGALIEVQPYQTPDAVWEQIGTSPVSEFRLANGLYRVRATLDGYAPAELVDRNPIIEGEYNPWQIKFPLPVELKTQAESPVDMVYVMGGVLPTMISGDNPTTDIDMQGFFFDKFEVTNRQFQEFVDAGGYESPTLWQGLMFTDGEKQLSTSDALSLFKDSTGRFGPAGWLYGRYPESKENYPVTGVSWYEAMAYARFTGKELPSVYHFKRASTNYLEWYAPLNASLIQQSNYTDALVAVGTYPGISQYGAADTAGNVREWAFNKTGRRSHAVMGGAHTQSEYMFVHTVESPPMNRDEITGFRLVQRLDPNLDEPHLYTQAMTIRDLTSEVDPVSDEVYKVLASQLVYRKRPITTEVLTFEHEHPNRRVEDIRLTTGAESLRLFIIIPEHIKPPYQAVIMFPGQDAFQFKLPVENQIRTRLLNNFLLNSGRVLIYPEYHGAHERYEGLYEMDDAEANIWYRDAVVKWRTEIGRTVDYLETRDDMSLDKVTFWGISFGTYNPISVLAVDDRFAAALLYLGGVLEHGRPPLAASYNFVPHIKIPVLQVNGRYDPIFDFETSQKRMFELLGTPAEDKELFIFEGGHVPSSQEQWQSISAKAVDWLDTRLGRP